MIREIRVQANIFEEDFTELGGHLISMREKRKCGLCWKELLLIELGNRGGVNWGSVRANHLVFMFIKRFHSLGKENWA